VNDAPPSAPLPGDDLTAGDAPPTTPPAASSAPPVEPPPPPDPPTGTGSTGSTPPPPPPPPEAPGLREQIAATKTAARELVDAHVELAKAEFEEISGEVKAVTVLAGIAIVAAILAGLLLAVGLPLFIGEWVFGSIGWGILHFVLLYAAAALTAMLIAAGIEGSRVGLAVGAGVAAGFAVAIILGTDLTNLLWGVAGDNLLPLAATDARPLATALVVLPVLLGFVFGVLSFVSTLLSNEARDAIRQPTIQERLLVAIPTALFAGWLSAFAVAYSQHIAWFDWRLLGALFAAIVVVEVVAAVIGRWRSGFSLLAGLSIGVVVGVVLGLFTAIAFGWRVSVAVGLTVGLATWIGTMAVQASQFFGNFDTEELKRRFVPQKTIDITKETIEWARARMPLSRGS
jgi:hypothetical protein